MTTPGTSPSAPLTPLPRRRSSLLVVLAALLVIALLAVIALPVGVYLGLRSETGTAWLLARLPGLSITGPRGPLLGDFSAERVDWLLPGSGDRLVLEAPAWEGLQIARAPYPGTWVALRLKTLRAQRATLTLAPRPPSTEPSAAPTSLRLPVAVQIDALTLGEFRTAALGDQPLRDVSVRLALGADAGSRHQVDDLSLSWDRVKAVGSLQIGTDAPLPLQVQLQLQPLTVAAAASAASAPGAASPAPPARPATPNPLDAWQADARLSGPLARPSLRASVRQTGTATSPLLEADAVLLPFAAWPLAELRAQTRGLDLSAFASAAPKTALSGQATVRSTGMAQAADADIVLDNGGAGLWNEGKLPLRSLRLLLQARPDQPQVATVQRFEAELGLAHQPAGRLQGRGGIDHGRWTLETTLDGVTPQHLDTRAAAMRLSGSLALGGGPEAASATPAAGAEATTLLTARGQLTGRIENPPSAAPAKRQAAGARATRPAVAAAKAAPAGTSAARPKTLGNEVKLAIDATARLGPKGAVQLDLKQAEASAGPARAQVDGKLARSDDAAPWQLKAQAALSDFDPRPWWAGADDSPWRRGPHRLNARATLDLSLAPTPQAAPPASPTRTAAGPTKPAAEPPGAALFAALPPLRGKAELLLKPSVLAGVALEGKAQLTASGTRPGPGQADATASLKAAGNRLTAKVSTRGDRPAADQWQVDVDAPALAALSPVAALFGLAAAPAPRTATGTAAAMTTAAASLPALSGGLSGQAKVSGRWPTVRSEGRLDAQALRAGNLALQRGELRWQVGTEADAPADLQATLSQLALGNVVADSATLRLSGTARAHQIVLNADSRALPPAWTEALSGPARAPATPPAAASGAASTADSQPRTAVTTPIPTTGPSPSNASLRAEGGLVFGTTTTTGGASTLAATGWRGKVQELNARSGSTAASAIGLRSRDLAIATAWAADAPASVVLQPGRVELQAGPTTAALRWSKLAWQAAVPAGPGRSAGVASIDAEAELEPIAVAPLLARFQPDFGWGGDLQVGGKLSLQSAPRLRADIVLERRRGDLSVTDEVGTQVLGLSDLRLAVNADNGVWSFTQALAGSTVGVAAGAVVARTGSPNAWPDTDTPIQGVLELRVANLGAWGPWVPAGWRLGGALNTSASIAGRIGAPEYTGSLRGTGLTVRNFAEGVNVTDGEVAIALQGTTARIEKFSARGGSGTVQLSGGASFGSAPEARLTLAADKFQLLGRVDRRIVASGQGQLQLDKERIALDGQFSVDEGLVDFTRGDAPSLSDDVVVTRPPKGSGQAAATQQVAEQKAGAAASKLGSEAVAARRAAPVAAKPAAAPTRTVALNLRVNLGEQLRLRGRGLDTGLRGDLRITSPGGRLAVNGTVSTQGGTYAAYGQKLSIDRGSVIFSGGIENPRLDIEATRPNTDVRVGVIVGGTAANPRIRLFSEPELPDVDKLSWLVLGRATDGLGRTDTALLQRAALALLSGEGEGVTDRLIRTIGLDEVSLRQTDGEVRETVISLGKQISQRWYVGYERGLNATAGSWQLIYRVAQRLTLRAQSGFENSLDVIWTWRWQ